MNRMNQPLAWVAGLAVLAFGTAARAADELPSLDQALRDNAPKIVKQLQERKYKNVGVLKFMVRNGDGPPRDNFGPLNSSLADRLEVALVLALDDNGLGIISSASKGVQASGNSRANHTTEDGRGQLFKVNKRYFTVPWRAGEGVAPDAFLSGEARLASDHRSLTVTVSLFDKDDPKTVRTVCEFKAAADLRTLTETGVTFSARGAFDDPVLLLAKATEAAPQADDKPDVLQKKADQALAALDKSPVQLTILYDKEEQHVQAAPVSADKTNVLLKVPTPKASVKEVGFRLENTGDETYGVVLKLNGHNTIKKEQQDALDCKKWILKPKEVITIYGFQLNDKDRDPFKVETPYESELSSVYYGDNAGTINLVVFRTGKVEEVLVKNDAPLASISRGMLVLRGEPKATDLKRFQTQLAKESPADQNEARSRGMVTGSGKIANSLVEHVEFVPQRVPLLSATIRYYEPRQK